MKCKCGKEIPENSRFCLNCGQPVGSVESLETNGQAPIQTSESIRTQKPRKRRGKWIAIVLVLVFFLSRCGGGKDSQTKNPTLKPRPAASQDTSTFSEHIVDRKKFSELQASACEPLKKLIVSKRAQLLKDQAVISTHPKALSDPFAASDFRVQHKFAGHDDYEKSLLKDAQDLIDNQMKTALDTSLTSNAAYALLMDTAFTCAKANSWPAKETLVEVLSMAESLDTNLLAMATLAMSLPWYPKGYSQLDDNLAVKWLKPHSYSCEYSGSSCWGLSVISAQGCPTSLYVAINIEDSSGTVVDWSNDTLPSLAPGKAAKLVFTSFSKGGSTARISDYSCL